MSIRSLRCASALVLAIVSTPSASVASSSPVALDLVVRDRKNLGVSDLRAEEVELNVDGVKVPFHDFRRVSSQPVGGAAAPAPQARLVVFVFPRLEAAERDLAREAAGEFLKKELDPGLSVAVLTVGPELVPVQGFTTDAAVLRDAVKRSLDPGARSGSPDVRTLYSLVHWLKDQPGRKTVLLFSSGLAVPAGFEDTVESVAGLANRYRISFYGVDPRGVELSRGAMRIDQAREADNVGLGGAAPEATTGVAVQKGTRVGSDLEGWGQSVGPSAQGPSAEALARLASATGGLLLERTNSFGKGMHQIAEDARAYYELSAEIEAPASGGALRTMELKVAREGTRVQARGPFLVGEAPAALVPAFEKRLAEALATEQPAGELQVWERALRFAWDGREMTHVLWIAVPLDKLSLGEGGAAGRFEGDLAILARVKDASGHVAAAFSQRLPLGGPLDQLASARAMTIPFVRQLKLAPGRYTLETAVHDRRGDKITARHTPLEVQPPQGIAMSSLALGELQPAGGAVDAENPLQIGKQRLVPNLGQPIKAGKGSMTLYSVIYPARGAKEPAQITIALRLGGQLANTASAALPPPDAAGRIPYATAFRMDMLPPGPYRFDVAVTQGASRAEESLSFTIVP